MTSAVVASRKTSAKPRSTTVSARRPLHPAAGTIAQLKDQNHSMIR
jgi:hypothetical protein